MSGRENSERLGTDRSNDHADCFAGARDWQRFEHFREMKFNWVWLIVGIIALTAFAAQSPRYGKWMFAIILLGALLLATDRITNSLGVN